MAIIIAQNETADPRSEGERAGHFRKDVLNCVLLVLFQGRTRWSRIFHCDPGAGRREVETVFISITYAGRDYLLILVHTILYLLRF